MKFLLSLALTGTLLALPPASYRLEMDWLVDPSGFKARVEIEEGRVELSNGLVRRSFLTGDEGFATIGYDNLATGESIIRAVRPDASLTIDGAEHRIGGMLGQPNHAFLRPQDLETMRFDPAAMKLVGMEKGRITEPFAWKRIRHHAPDAEWPPPGVALRFDFVPSLAPGDAPREVLWQDDFTAMDAGWRRFESSVEERISFENEGKPGEILSPSGRHCFAERAIPEGTEVIEVGLHPGTDRSGGGWGPGAALLFGDQVVKVNLRPGDRGVHGHFELRVNGHEALASPAAFRAEDGGLILDHGYRLRAQLSPSEIIWTVAADTADPTWRPLFIVPRPGPWGTPTTLRVGKMDRRAGASDLDDYPGEWGRCRVTGVAFLGVIDESKLPSSDAAPFRVSLHYELYDGIPLMVKWLTVENAGDRKITVDRFTAETLALVEHSNHVEHREGVDLPRPQTLHVETDMAFGGFNDDHANRHTVHYRTDPLFKTQVNYALQQPCLLVVEPTYGPSQDVEPGGTFTSFRVLQLAMDSTERERRGLAIRRMHRTLAPWVTENPLMHHMRDANPARVRTAIDQAAEVGFEMVILSFGSGFNAENDDPAYLATWKEINEHARSKGIDLGCYSLYSSRRIGGGEDIVTPDDQRPAHGNCPAITSAWGQAYLKKLYHLFETTGFTVFEHDGAYPGDVDTTPRPPLQKGIEDSRWVHWRIWTDYYKWLRGRGVYLNTPDYYFHSGANQCGMGYREVNWSLPRDQQLIHTRQNIFDGTWRKTPSMGWMFVPLSEYHGGGAAATIEPLDEHIDHYRLMMLSNLALGVQACYRGPRLYDTPHVRDMVRETVGWYKQHRDILESDLIHLRRADGRRLDGMLHVNPSLDEKAMLCVFNPTDQPLRETWTVPLYYAGLTESASVSENGGTPSRLPLDPLQRARLDLEVEPMGFTWILFQ